MFENSAWTNMVQILLYIIFLLLYSLNGNADWIGMLIITTAMINHNSALLYFIFMSYCRIPHCQNGISLIFNHHQNITNSSTNSYIRTDASSSSTSTEKILQAWRILINTKHCDVRVVYALANHKSQFCLY